MPDDFSADILTTGLIAVNGTATGEIEDSFDRDYFKVSLIAGRIYSIELRGSETGDGTLPDPFLSRVIDFNGDDILGTAEAFTTGFNDNATPGTLNSAATFYATYTGDYFLGVSASSFSGLASNLGTYTLEITDLANATTVVASRTYLGATSGDDSIPGQAGEQAIFGLAGDDLIEGGDGNDLIVGGFGADTIFGGDGDDTIIGANGPITYFPLGFELDETDLTITDVIHGGDGDDSINPSSNLGNANNAIIFGGSGNDTITGAGPVQFIDGGTGQDYMWGSTGVTTYVVDDIGDVIKEFSYDAVGADGRATGDIDEIRSKITWELDPWNLFGGEFQVENLTLLDLNDSGQDGDDPSDNIAVNLDGTGNEVGNVITGNSGNNRLDGVEGPDTIIGGAGDDTIIGGVGDDSLTGGTGADQFDFASGDGDDVISDFEIGVDLLPTGWVEGTAAGVSSTVIGGSTVFTHGINDTVTLTGVVFPLPNANPVFTSIPPGPINEDEPFTFNFSASDPDGDPVSIVPGSLIIPSWIIAGAGLTGTPTQANVGTAGNEVSLTIQDGRGGTATQSFIIEVLNVNDDPTFTTTAITTAQTGTVYSYTPLFADEDGDIPTVDLALSTIPNWITFNRADGTFSGTPQQSDAGLVGNDLIIVIIDGMGGTATQTAAINVALSNQNPVFTSTPPLTTNEDAVFSYQITASDPDSDPLLFTRDTLPSWATVSETGLVSGTPLQADVGVNGNNFSFSLSDGNGGTAIQTFTLNVLNVNDDPMFTTTPITAAQTGTVYTYTPLFADEDGDIPTVDLALSNIPSWLTFNRANGTFSGTPQQNDIGLVGNDLIIAINDGIGGTATQTVAINVANGNQDPFFTSTPPLTANEDTLFTYQISVDDPDSDVVELTVDVPDWINVDETGLLTGTPLQSDVSEVANQFSFTVTDGNGGTATQSFTLNVLNVNDDPTFDTIPAPSLAATEGVLYSYTPTFDDEDGDIPTVDLANSVIPSWLTFDASTGTFSGTPAQADEGVETVTIAISDGNGGTATRTFDVTVTTVNDAPIAGDDTVAGIEDTPLILSTLLDNDSDPDLDTLSIGSITQAANGSVTLNGDGTVTYTPDDDFNGEDTFTYTVSDGVLDGVNPATVTVIVAPVNDDPTGEVTINGTFEIGGVLTADTSALGDIDGLGTFSYRWVREDSGIAILPSTTDTYVLTRDDAGRIVAVVSYTDGGGTEETVASTGIQFTPDPRIIGTPGPDSLVGTLGEDTLVGLEDDDTLDGGGGVDTLDGGAGDDLYLLDSAADSVFEYENAGFDSVVIGEDYTLPDHVEELQLRDTGDINGTGNGLDNALFGNLGANVLSGLSGNDTLNGAGGGDTLNGGSGDDLYIITSLTDVVIELEDEGIDEIQSVTNVVLGDHIENITLVGDEVASGLGNALDNVIIGNDASNALFGAAGADTLEGGGGRDLLYDGDGIDRLIGGEGDDFYVVGADIALDQNGNSITDVIVENAGEGIDTVYSYAQAFVLPDHVENLILTSLFSLVETAQQNIDTVAVAAAPGASGTRAPSFGDIDPKELLKSEQGNIYNIATNANGTGNALDNEITGDATNNVLSGMAGSDTLDGSKGRDTLTGGDGADVFRYIDFADGGVSFFGPSENISDFVVGEDKIDLSQLVLNAGSAASNPVIGGLQTSGFTFLGEVLSTGRAGDITTARIGDLTLVSVESGSTTKPDLSFFVTSDAALSATDFKFEADEVVVITPSPADLIPTPADAPEGTRSVGLRADLSPLALGLESEAGLDVGPAYRFEVPVDADYFIAENFDINGTIGIAANFGPVDPTSPAPAVSTSNGWGLGAQFDFGDGGIGARYIIDGRVELTDTEDAGVLFDALGARFRFLTQDGLDESFILDIDRDLDGVKDFELELINVDEDTLFRTELVNGNLNISIYDGNSGPTGKLTIDGSPRVFENLTANADNLFDRDGIVQSTVSFQWLNNGVAIEGATESDYRARISDVGDLINVRMTYTDVFGTDETVLSETFQPIGVASQAAQGDVAITGTPRQGETLSVDVSDITDRNITDPRTATYQWQRDGVDIADANGFTYTLTQDDVGAQINVVYDFRDLGGDNENKVSALTVPIENVNDAPRATITLGGLLQVGSAVRADADLFDLDGIDLFVAQTYQWFRDGTAIAGETSQIYRVTTEDIQEELSVRVGFTDGFGTPEFVTSTGFEVPLQGIRTIGTPASELLLGSIGADQLFGTGGDDTLIGGASDDLLSGGSGSDTAVYSGNQSSYTVTLSGQGVTVEDRRSDAQGGEGTDTMTDISFLDFGEEIPEFAGGPMGLDLYGQLPAVSSEEFTAFVELYIAYFNRAPDAIGLFFWGSVLQLPDWDLERIAVEGFFPQDETQATYPDLTDIEGFAKKVYTNVLGRDFDQEGLDFWIGVLEGGFVSLPKFMLQIIEGAKVDAQPGASEEFIAQQAADVAYLANKAELGTYFSVIKGMSNVENSRAVMSLYDGSQASIDAAKASTDNFYADALDAENGEFLFSLAGVVDDPFAIF